MTRDMPNDADQARNILVDVAHRMGLDVSTVSIRGRDGLRLVGQVNGVPVTADVAVRDSLGAAYYDVKTTLEIEPSLDLGFVLTIYQQATESRGEHLPGAWWRALGARASATSNDPVSVRAILAAVPLPGFELTGDITIPSLTSLTDDQAVMESRDLGTGRAVEKHLEDAARWTAALAAAGRDFAPDDHAFLQAEVWRPLHERLGGDLSFRPPRFACETPVCQLAVEADWHEERGYRLRGSVTWPALPFDTLRLTPQAERSWLRRLFMRDVEIGRADFDRAFIIDASPTATLERLVTDRVQKAALVLLGQVDGLTIEAEGASFVLPDAEATPVHEVVEAALELGRAVATAFADGRGAYR